jgi:hypothetical protein
MANVKITDLVAYTNPVSTDVLAIVDVGADTTKKVSIAALLQNASSGTAAAPGIAFDGDNIGIYRPGADQVAISTNGTEKLRITSDGKLGLGTSSPQKLLEISSSTDATIRINDPATIGAVNRYIGGVEYYTNDSSGGAKVACSIKGYHVDISGNGRLQFATGNETTAMTIDGSQRVGIGTTSPESILQVGSNSNDNANTSNYISFGRRATTTENSMPFIGMAGANGGNQDLGLGARSANGVIKFYTGSAGDAFNAALERLRIDENGDVGIGTTSPDSRFEVLDDSATGIISRSTNTQSTNTNKALKVRNNSDTDTFNVSYKGQGYFADSVGIGTTSPSSELHVQGNLSGGQLLVTTSTTNSTQKYGTIGTLHYTNAEQPALGLAVQSNSTDNNVLIGGALGQFNAATNVRFYTAGNNTTTTGTERARIDGAGRLLVGTSSAPSGPDGITPKIASASVGGATAAADLQIAAYQAAGGSGRAKVSGKLFLGHSRSGVSGALGGVVLSGDNLGEVRFWGDDGTNAITAAEIVAQVDGTPGTNDMPGRIVLSTTATGASTPTERMRINNGGSTTVFSSLGNTFISRSSTSAGTTDNLFAGLHSATSTTNGTQSFVVRTNGNVQNTNDSYGAISDIKLKENIVDAESQWDDFKAVRFRKYNFKEETGHETFTQLGVIAQELELVSPGLVTETPDLDEDGNDLGTTTKSVKYSVLTKKALVALQEAMDRIEQLETSNADLLARVTALEGN